ncbi:uncharacterized protein FIESC28_05295 [Fusarium coffeatum]|uniref:SGNH hydrolase-type esterase domain-containing protein n=1 Tax=Fusarium coffeatum TaxID=231269 RepID=A0A366RTB5_9HYPO|nr:uncharacterized protein FIESC28_05295 [Fusarium coffeatum]RBR20331.1 hypothetical protein FIESC28_05295 [Fusarium coffeatum]
MADSDNEGYPGWTIESVHGAWPGSKWMKPNLVLINAGLNDCNAGSDPSKAGERTRSLVDDILNSVPGVTLIVSTLFRNADATRDACTADISRQIKDVVAEFKGAPIGLADVRNVMSLSDIGPDKDHPTDAGYKVFAGVWWDAISKIEDRIQEPGKVNTIDDAAGGEARQCKKVAGNAGLHVQSQMGSGHDDGNYVHKSVARGALQSARIDKGDDPKSIKDAIPWHIFFANIDKNAYWFRQNLGGGKFGKAVQSSIDMNCDLGPRYAFADFVPGYVTDDPRCSRNGGSDDSPQWQGFSSVDGIRGTVFNIPQGDKAGILIADLNGDFRNDVMYVGDNGNVRTWINNRDTGKGIEQKDYYDVVVWQNQGAGGTKLKADGNYYCDMRGSGSDEYVWIYQDGHAADINVNIHSPPAWGHSTTISLHVPGPRNGIHLADWTGDGKCDVIVQNRANGDVTIFRNLYDGTSNRITFDSGLTYVSSGCTQGWGVGLNDLSMRFHDIEGRANIRFADVENSGRADLLHVDKYTGAVDVFTNNGHKPQGGSSFSWTKRGTLYNPIDRGENMRFTNQGGQGRADLVKVDPTTNKALSTSADPGLPVTGGGSVVNPPDGDYPKVHDGSCEGPDCHGGVCTGILCCTGSDCEGNDDDDGGGGGGGRKKGGRWRRFQRHSCTGPDCVDGICVGPQCFKSHDHNGGGCEGNGCPHGGGGESGGGAFPVSTEHFVKSPKTIAKESNVYTWDLPAHTDFIECTHRNQDPGQGINQAYCVCSGSTFAESVATIVTPYNSCGYTTMPTKTIDPSNSLPVSTNTAECKVCTSLTNCVPEPTSDPNLPASEAWSITFYKVQLPPQISPCNPLHKKRLSNASVQNQCRDNMALGEQKGRGERTCRKIEEDVDCFNGSTNQFSRDLHVCGYMTDDCTAERDDQIASIGPMSGPDNGHAIIWTDESVQKIRSWKVMHGDCSKN